MSIARNGLEFKIFICVAVSVRKQVFPLSKKECGVSPVVLNRHNEGNFFQIKNRLQKKIMSIFGKIRL